MFRTAKNPNADSTQEAMFKENSHHNESQLKSGVKTKARASAFTTDQVGVLGSMGATNDPLSEVEEALKTRFFWGNFEQQRRVGRY